MGNLLKKHQVIEIYKLNISELEISGIDEKIQEICNKRRTVLSQTKDQKIYLRSLLREIIVRKTADD